MTIVHDLANFQKHEIFDYSFRFQLNFKQSSSAQYKSIVHKAANKISKAGSTEKQIIYEFSSNHLECYAKLNMEAI